MLCIIYFNLRHSFKKILITVCLVLRNTNYFVKQFMFDQREIASTLTFTCCTFETLRTIAFEGVFMFKASATVLTWFVFARIFVCEYKQQNPLNSYVSTSERACVRVWCIHVNIYTYGVV